MQCMNDEMIWSFERSIDLAAVYAVSRHFTILRRFIIQSNQKRSFSFSIKQLHERGKQYTDSHVHRKHIQELATHVVLTDKKSEKTR